MHAFAQAYLELFHTILLSGVSWNVLRQGLPLAPYFVSFAPSSSFFFHALSSAVRSESSSTAAFIVQSLQRAHSGSSNKQTGGTHRVEISTHNH